jgi:SHS2 domain-containing protein
LVKRSSRPEHFEHGADIGVRGVGASVEDAFAAAAQAVSMLVAHDLSRVGSSLEERVVCSAPGLEELLVAFLNEVISLMDARGLVFGSFAVSIARGPEDAWRLEARARGEPFDPARHEATVEPKGATFTELRVSEEDGRWVAQCVVDV